MVYTAIIVFLLQKVIVISGERSLKETDIPLLERLMLGPSDSVKIFIRDTEDSRPTVNPAHIPGDSSPTTETPDEGTPLPEEVSFLPILSTVHIPGDSSPKTETPDEGTPLPEEVSFQTFLSPAHLPGTTFRVFVSVLEP